MSAYLHSLGRWCARRAPRVLAAWLLLIAILGGAVSAVGMRLTDTFTISGTESMKGLEVLDERLPQAAGTSEQVLFTASDGDIGGHADAVNAFASRAADIDGVAMVSAPFGDAQTGTSSTVSADGAHALVQVQADTSVGSVLTGNTPRAAEVARDLEDLADQAHADDPAVDIQLGGNIGQKVGIGISGTELVGVVIAAVVLLVTFGSVLAAGAPLVAASLGVGTGMLGILLAAAATDINSTTPVLAVMIGLAVGIDYALFILSRFRSELIDHINGHDLTPKQLSTRLREISREDRAHLAGLAVGKAGSAVVFAGLTVLIALAALTIVNISFLSAMALAAAATVAVAVLVAITLLPAILGLVGTRVFSVTAPFVTAPDPEQEKPTMGLRWIRQVRSRPLVFLGAGALVLILLAIPAMNLRLSMPTDGVTEPGSPRRVAYEMTEEAFGPGRNSPMIAVVDATSTPEDQRMQNFGAAVEKLQGTDGVSNAQIIALNDAQDTAQVLITPEYGATDERTSDLLHDLRNNADNYKITGVGPMFEDISQRLNDALLPYLAVVLSLAFVLLMLVFRSIWVPLIATLGFALTVAATFGLTVLIWQQGFAGLVSDPQPLISFLPIMLVGIVFGLAMDYQVFLVSRMREGYVHGKTAGNAVANGFKHGARVVTAAALIMISVFAAFMLIDEKFIVVMGFALAVAVFFDAFIVRMTIIPATMFLLDDRAWRLPRWLDRMIPHVDIEGESLTRKAPVH